MKNPFKSKTLWVNVIIAVVAFFPNVSKIFTPDQVMIALAGLNMILRLVTKDKIGLE